MLTITCGPVVLTKSAGHNKSISQQTRRVEGRGDYITTTKCLYEAAVGRNLRRGFLASN